MKTEWNGGTDYEENPQGGKVASLTGEEQNILSDLCLEMRLEGAEKVELQRKVAEYTKTIELYQKRSRERIDYMAKRFELTKSQVIKKILAENKKYNIT